MTGQEMTLDAMLAQMDERARQPALLMTEEMRRLQTRGEIEGVKKTCAQFLYSAMLTVETLFDGSKPDTGQLLDDAVTHFLASLQAELGDGYAKSCAAAMIRNIALFLDGRKRDMVLAALDVEGKSQ